MSILYVNTGSSANKGDGDSLRTAFNKINYNFSQLSELVNASSATITTSAFPPSNPTDGALWFDTISGRSYIWYDNFWVDSNPPAVNPIPWTFVESDIIPASNLTYDLGSTSSQWRSLYVGTSTIYLGGTALSVSGGNITLNGNPVSGSGASNTGNIGFTATTIYSLTGLTINNGDLSHGSTAGVSLPTNGNTSSVVISNTYGNISIIAGENLTTKQWIFDGYGQLTPPSGFTIDHDGINFGTEGNYAYINIPGNAYAHTYNEGISITNMDGPISLTAGLQGGTTHAWKFNTNGGIELPGYGVLATYGHDVVLLAGNDGVSTYGNVNIQTNSPSNTSTWTFGTQGELTLPLGGIVQEGQITNEIFGNTTTSLTLIPGGSGGSGQRLEIYGTIVGGEGNHLHLTSGDPFTDIYLGNDTNYVSVSNIGSVTVGTSGQTWKFDGVGLELNTGTGAITNLKTLNSAQTPESGDRVTNVRYWDSAGVNLYVWLDAASTPELVTLGNFGSLNGWTVSLVGGNTATIIATNPAGYFSITTDVALTGAPGTLTFTSPAYIPQGYSPVDVTVGVNTWTFSNTGTLLFPDNTTQTTAYRFVTPPTSSTSTGVAGALAQDATYFYVCTATNAWQRIAWDTNPW